MKNEIEKAIKEKLNNTTEVNDYIKYIKERNKEIMNLLAETRDLNMKKVDYLIAFSGSICNKERDDLRGYTTSYREDYAPRLTERIMNRTNVLEKNCAKIINDTNLMISSVIEKILPIAEQPTEPEGEGEEEK